EDRDVAGAAHARPARRYPCPGAAKRRAPARRKAAAPVCPKQDRNARGDRVVGELARIIDEHVGADVVRPTFVYTRDGSAYTVDGIGAMFRRYCKDAKVADFGLRDLRAKGATDEYRAGRPLRELQHLLGHRSQQTTEIYI